MTEYVVYKKYEKRIGKGKMPDIQTRYLSELPPAVDMTENIDFALRFTKEEAKELSFLIAMDYKKL